MKYADRMNDIVFLRVHARKLPVGCAQGGVTAVAKHFCAQGECRGGVNASAASIGPRELREIHLPPALACCKAGTGGIMAAYNEIDGLSCHANSTLLRGILRGEFSFEGIVMADGTAIDRLDALTGDNIQSGALALKAGVDVSLWDTGFSTLEKAVKEGYIPEALLDEAVLRILKLKFERGLFEHPFLNENEAPKSTAYQNYPHSLELARQGIVLLKNGGGILPLIGRQTKKIAVIGPNADEVYAMLGDYSPPIRREEAVTVLEGLHCLCGSNYRVGYARGCGVFDGTDEEMGEAETLAAQSDVVIMVIGGSSSRFSGSQFDKNGAAITGGTLQMDCGEGVDCASLTLCGRQQELFDHVYALGKPIITVLIGGRPYAVPVIAEKSTAFLAAFYPGPEGGRAVAEVLLGIIEPGGRLPVSFPRSSGQLPVYYNSRDSYHAMGYRDLPDTPLFCFGDGLSYTAFHCDNVLLSNTRMQATELKARVITLTFTMRNTGNRGGWTVPSLYIHGLTGSVVRRKKELRAFKKMYLNAGETVTAALTLGFEELAVWDVKMNFTVEAGTVELSLEDGGKRLWRGELGLY